MRSTSIFIAGHYSGLYALDGSMCTRIANPNELEFVHIFKNI